MSATRIDATAATPAPTRGLGASAPLLVANLFEAILPFARNIALARLITPEEFGLAIVEALAAGLPVVAPLAGGPATYVEEGRTGRLVDTSDPAALARGVAGALDLAGRPGRAEYAAETIASRYDISGMARDMTSVYRRVAIGSRDSMAS